jgi:hypothetical protein
MGCTIGSSSSRAVQSAQGVRPLEAVPSRQEFRLVQLGPRLDEAALLARNRPCDQLNRIEAKNADIILIIRVEVWQMVRSANFHVHPNDDAEEAAQFGHGIILHRKGAFERLRPE